MEHISFIPRDDVYGNKSNDRKAELRLSLGTIIQEQLAEDESPEVEEKIAQETIETVFEKLRIDEENTDSIILTSVVDKQFEVTNELSTSASKQNLTLTPSTNTLVSNTNALSVEDSQPSKLNGKRANSSRVFPVGCMGCTENTEQNCVPNINGDSPNREEAKEGDETREGTRRPMIKRKDGNPLLGVGYEDSRPSFNVTCKIPPGGFSHGLW